MGAAPARPAAWQARRNAPVVRHGTARRRRALQPALRRTEPEPVASAARAFNASGGERASVCGTHLRGSRQPCRWQRARKAGSAAAAQRGDAWAAAPSARGGSAPSTRSSTSSCSPSARPSHAKPGPGSAPSSSGASSGCPEDVPGPAGPPRGIGSVRAPGTSACLSVWPAVPWRGAEAGRPTFEPERRGPFAAGPSAPLPFLAPGRAPLPHSLLVVSLDSPLDRRDGRARYSFPEFTGSGGASGDLRVLGPGLPPRSSHPRAPLAPLVHPPPGNTRLAETVTD